MAFYPLRANDYVSGYLIKRELFFYDTVYETYDNPSYRDAYTQFSCEHYEKVKAHKFCPECGKLVVAREIPASPKMLWKSTLRLRQCFEDVSVDKDDQGCRTISLHDEKFDIHLLIKTGDNRFAIPGAYDNKYGYCAVEQADYVFIVAENMRYFTEWSEEDFEHVIIAKSDLFQ